MNVHLIMPLTVILLSACSSPPPAEPVPWNIPGKEINNTLPQWDEKQSIIPSPSPAGSWSVVIRAFRPQDKVRHPAEYYAVAHATRIVVEAPDTTDWFRAKSWLRQNGAQGVIGWQPARHCLACNGTRIYLSR